MASVRIDISNQQLQTLQTLASAQGVPLEMLLQESLANWLNHQQKDFTTAADYVLKKNAELYRRLA